MKRKKLKPNSNPKKHAAFAGKARNIVGVKPLNNAFGPSSDIISLNTSRIPGNGILKLMLIVIIAVDEN